MDLREAQRPLKARYRESPDEVRDLVERAVGEVERLVERIAAGEASMVDGAKEPDR